MVRSSFTLRQRQVAAFLMTLLVGLLFVCVGEVPAIGDERPAAEQQGDEEDGSDARPLSELSGSLARVSPGPPPAPRRRATLSWRRSSPPPLPLVCRHRLLQPVPFTVRVPLLI